MQFNLRISILPFSGGIIGLNILILNIEVTTTNFHIYFNHDKFIRNYL